MPKVDIIPEEDEELDDSFVEALHIKDGDSEVPDAKTPTQRLLKNIKMQSGNKPVINSYVSQASSKLEKMTSQSSNGAQLSFIENSPIRQRGRTPSMFLPAGSKDLSRLQKFETVISVSSESSSSSFSSSSSSEEGKASVERVHPEIRVERLRSRSSWSEVHSRADKQKSSSSGDGSLP